VGQTKSDWRKTPKHVRVLHSMMDTAAYRAASGNSIKVLLALVRKDNGERNGRIAFSCREAAKLTGLSVRTCQRCLIELDDLGFIRCTEKGAFSRKMQHASLYRYTWQAWPEGKMGPTRDYETWQPDENSRMQVLHDADANLAEADGNTPSPDAEFATGQDGNPVISANSTSDRIATLNSTRGTRDGEPESGQRKQANSCTAAILDDLRTWTLDHLKRNEVGEQSRLADGLGIPAGTLSKFLNGGNLPAKYREPLTDAVVVY